MSTILEVQPDIASKIASQAKAHGVSVDVYLRSLIEEETKTRLQPTLSPQEKARLWREWAASHNHDTPLLSDEAISRESIYGERG
ncbi:MAG: hypothetical protein ACRD63_17415 [Pyrinomonadaceae bacterium]